MLTYSPANDTWQSGTVAPMNFGRGDVGGAVINGIGYVYGGYSTDSFCQPLRYVESFNPAWNNWTLRAPLPDAVAEKEDGAVLGGRIFVIGGEKKAVTAGCIDQDLVPTRAVYAYDPRTNAWSNETTLPDAHFRFGATAGNNVIYVAGGQGPIVDNSVFPVLYGMYAFDYAGYAAPVATCYNAGAVAGAVIGGLIALLLSGGIGFYIGLKRSGVIVVRGAHDGEADALELNQSSSKVTAAEATAPAATSP